MLGNQMWNIFVHFQSSVIRNYVIFLLWTRTLFYHASALITIHTSNTEYPLRTSVATSSLAFDSFNAESPFLFLQPEQTFVLLSFFQLCFILLRMNVHPLRRIQTVTRFNHRFQFRKKLSSASLPTSHDMSMEDIAQSKISTMATTVHLICPKSAPIFPWGLLCLLS